MPPLLRSKKRESASSSLDAKLPSSTKNECTITTETDENPKSWETSVRFSTAEFRHYPIIIGDNPSVTRGIPITLGWKHWEEATIVVPVEDAEGIALTEETMESTSVNTHEAMYRKQQKSAPKHPVRVWTPLERVSILRASGYSREELIEAIRLQTISRMNRLEETTTSPKMLPQSIHTFVVEPIQETWKLLGHGMRCCLPPTQNRRRATNEYNCYENGRCRLLWFGS